jgi:putative endonuclease
LRKRARQEECETTRQANQWELSVCISASGKRRRLGILNRHRGYGFSDVQLHIGESITPVFVMPYYVYLLASKKHGTLYLGVTNDIVRRGHEHRTKAVDGFTSRYGIDKLVWFEIYDDAATAIAREKELKKWRRDWKIRLIEDQNPGWVDLYPGISN